MVLYRRSPGLLLPHRCPEWCKGLCHADAAAQAATTVPAVEEATAALGAAVTAFLSGSTLLEGRAFDVTWFYVTNPTPYYTHDGWTCSDTPTQDSHNRCSEFWNKP